MAIHVKNVLIQPGDLPSWNIAGEQKVLKGDNPILRNVGGAAYLVIQWIGNVENRAEIGGEVRLYAYLVESLAEKFYQRLIDGFEGEPLTSIGNDARIRHGSDFSPLPPVTSIRFWRKQFVVQLQGTYNEDPSFARSRLSHDSVIRYAKLLDARLQNLIENHRDVNLE